MEAHAFNLNTQEADVGWSLCEFEAGLMYIVSFKTARDTKWDLFQRRKQTKELFFTAISVCHYVINVNFQSLYFDE